jgi:hypothetical protein
MADARVLSPEVLGEWTERWRYPELLEALGAGDELDTRQAADAVLAGLMAPPSSPPDAVRRFIERGEFAVAEELLADSRIFGDALSDDEFTGLHNLIDKSRQQAAVDLHREIRELAERARRCDATQLSQSALTGIDTTAVRSRTAAYAQLAEFRIDVENTEKALTKKLSNELDSRPDAPEPWRASVRASLAAREFGVVRKQLDDGPGADEFAGPGAVPRLRPDEWPWPKHPLPEVLDWYEDSPAPTGFAQWAPPPGDDRARRLVAAMSAVSAELTRDTVREFAAALDGLFGVEEVVP